MHSGEPRLSVASKTAKTKFDERDFALLSDNSLECSARDQVMPPQRREFATGDKHCTGEHTSHECGGPDSPLEGHRAVELDTDNRWIKALKIVQEELMIAYRAAIERSHPNSGS